MRLVAYIQTQRNRDRLKARSQEYDGQSAPLKPVAAIIANLSRNAFRQHHHGMNTEVDQTTTIADDQSEQDQPAVALPASLLSRLGQKPAATEPADLDAGVDSVQATQPQAAVARVPYMDIAPSARASSIFSRLGARVPAQDSPSDPQE